MMDVEKLIEGLNQYSQSLIAYKLGADFADACTDAATAISTLKDENESLKEKLYDGEGVNLVDYWMQQAKIEENGHRNCQAENEKLRAELERMKKIMRDNGIMTIPPKYPGGPTEWNIPKPRG